MSGKKNQTTTPKKLIPLRKAPNLPTTKRRKRREEMAQKSTRERIREAKGNIQRVLLDLDSSRGTLKNKLERISSLRRMSGVITRLKDSKSTSLKRISTRKI